VISAAGRRLRVWLKASKRSQSSLARELRISPGYITMLLAGARTPSLEVAKRLQDVTGIPATAFIRKRAA